MTKWQATFLGLKHFPRELSGFEIEAFFTFTLPERHLIEERRLENCSRRLAHWRPMLARMMGRSGNDCDRWWRSICNANRQRVHSWSVII